MKKQPINTSNEFVKSLPELLYRLNSGSQHYFMEKLASWKTGNLYQYRDCVQLCRDYYTRVMALSDPATPETWQILDEMVHQLLAWTENNLAEAREQSIIEYDSYKYTQAPDTTLFPAQVTILLDETWVKGLTDSDFQVYLGKQQYRLQLNYNNALNRAQNSLRKLRKQTPLPRKEMYRTFPVQPFLEYYYQLPVYQLINQAIQSIQRKTIVLQFELHQQVSEFISAMVAVQELGNTLINNESLDLVNALKTAEQKLPDLVYFTDDLERLINELQMDLHAELEAQNKVFLRNWNYAGSGILSVKKFNNDRIAGRKESVTQRAYSQLLSWQNAIGAENQDWKKDLELAQLALHSVMICVESVGAIHHKINDQVLPLFTAPQNALQEAYGAFENLTPGKEDGLRAEILALNRLTIRSLRRETIPKIVDAITTAQIPKTLENYLSRIKFNVEKLPDVQSVFAENDKEINDRQMAEIPLKNLVMSEIYPNITHSHAALMADTQQKIDKILRDLSEIDQIVEFNLLAALDLLEQQDSKNSDSHQVVVEGLDRAMAQFTDLVEQCTEIDQFLQKGLLDATIDFRGKIHELENSEKIRELQLRITKARTKAKLVSIRKNSINTVVLFFPRVRDFINKYLLSIKNAYLRFRKITRLGVTDIDSEQVFVRFMIESQTRIEKMPFVYQRLFRQEPLRDDRFFAGREQELATLKSIFDSWLAQSFTATALIGENGSGRTTLLHFAEEQIFRPTPVFKLELTQTLHKEDVLLQQLAGLFPFVKKKTKSYEALEKQLSENDHKVVCVIENAHKLFLRTVNGFEALERLLLFISRTQHKVFWILSFGLYGWHYLDKAIGLKRFFSNVITLVNMSSTSIENIILKRHRVSGYRLHFAATKEIEGLRKYNRLTSEEEKQRFLHQHYFDQLNRMSQGNITVAILIWLLSIKEIQQDKLVITPVAEFDVSFLQQMSSDVVFTLAALLQHNILTEQEYAEIFRIDVQQSQTMLDNLKNKGLLVKTDEGYKIHNLLYRSIVKNLKINNILYD